MRNNLLTADSKRFAVLSCILYIVCPLLGLGGLLLIVLTDNKNKRLTYIFFVLLALYIGLINSTKIPFSDQIQYMEAYKLVPHRHIWNNLTGIYGYGNSTTKEMGYGLLNIVGFYLSFGFYPLFITLFTVALYMLYFTAIYRWFHLLKIKNPTGYTISAVLVLAFFTQFFNLTIHLQRQEIATALMIHALIIMLSTGKVPWLLVIISISLHTSVGLFLPLFMLFQFTKGLTLRRIILIIGGMSLLLPIVSILASSFTGNIYMIERLQNMGTSEETAMSGTLVAIVSIPLTIISIKYLYDNRKQKTLPVEAYLFLFYLFNISFSAFNPDSTMQYRYFMMSYGFIPFILPLVSKKQGAIRNIVLIMIPIFFFLRFFITFEDITFQYAPLDNVMTSNIFSLYNYYGL